MNLRGKLPGKFATKFIFSEIRNCDYFSFENDGTSLEGVKRTDNGNVRVFFSIPFQSKSFVWKSRFVCDESSDFARSQIEAISKIVCVLIWNCRFVETFRFLDWFLVWLFDFTILIFFFGIFWFHYFYKNKSTIHIQHFFTNWIFQAF